MPKDLTAFFKSGKRKGGKNPPFILNILALFHKYREGICAL